MRHTAIVLLFAASLAAQAVVDPKVELAPAIAVEEQERDLNKAETMYRDLLAGTSLSESARTLANQRLGRLLQKLGRQQEAAPFLAAAKKGSVVALDDVTQGLQDQDLEREKALREKARGLVQQVLGQRSMTVSADSPLWGIPRPLAEQLLWVGAPAVPEAIAALEAAEKAESYSPNPLRALAGFLWYVGGPKAGEFLQRAAHSERLALPVAEAAGNLRDPAMLEVAAAFLRHANFVVTQHLLEPGYGNLVQRFTPEQIVDAAEAGGAEWKAYVLQWARRYLDGVELQPATLARLHRLVRSALASSDPELGSAAQQFLLTAQSQASIEGIELLLRELPAMRGQIRVGLRHLQVAAGAEPPQRFTVEVARRLLPQVDACARAIEPEQSNGPALSRRQWLAAMMDSVARPLGTEVVPTVLGWADLGYECLWVLGGRVTLDNAKEVFARVAKVADKQVQPYVTRLFDVPLPPDLFPMMRETAQRLVASSEPVSWFAMPMARTSNPEAADWMLAEWRRSPGNGVWEADALVELGRRSRAENVRAAMRTVAGENWHVRNLLLLALLSMHDEAALDLVAKSGDPGSRLRHPYAVKEPHPSSVGVTPLEYLLYRDPDPPHGFTEEQIARVLRGVVEAGVSWQTWQIEQWSPSAIPDRLLGEVARLMASGPILVSHNVSTKQIRVGWASAVLSRTRQTGSDHGALRDWIPAVLQDEHCHVRDRLIGMLYPDEVERARAAIESCLDDDDAALALASAQALRECSQPVAFARLLQNAHANVRAFAIDALAANSGTGAASLVLPLVKDPDVGVRVRAAACFGAIVAKDAVPALLEMLRDPDEPVRTAAADALTRIRFYHEQQAHWDRVLKGLDASSASAAEKLLLQAKPGAAKEQRLLAIESLGTLGVPEALPFLIDWTQDPDAEIAAKAKAAVTAIHLN
ncbi:MAG TPA: HEAT repeat domain-containing protein, partial [Planctomycetota bacterium]|nr:HEAT repeat domain-containing protein [Planctomycetota bacterium]